MRKVLEIVECVVYGELNQQHLESKRYGNHSGYTKKESCSDNGDNSGIQVMMQGKLVAVTERV